MTAEGVARGTVTCHCPEGNADVDAEDVDDEGFDDVLFDDDEE